MIKEAKNVDFLTTGRQPSEQDFAYISEWIRWDKQKKATRKNEKEIAGKEHVTHAGLSQDGQKLKHQQ